MLPLYFPSLKFKNAPAVINAPECFEKHHFFTQAHKVPGTSAIFELIRPVIARHTPQEFPPLEIFSVATSCFNANLSTYPNSIPSSSIICQPL